MEEEDKRKVEHNSQTLAIMERKHDIIFAELGNTHSNSNVTISWMLRGIHDHEASSSHEVSVISSPP